MPPCILDRYKPQEVIKSEPNPYFWRNDGGWWPYPWDNWPTKTPWDRQRNRGTSGQLVEPEAPGSTVISNSVKSFSRAPTPSTEYEGLPLASSMEGDLSSFLPDLLNDDQLSPFAADTTNMGVDNIFQEQPGGNLDMSLLPIPGIRIWDEPQYDPIASVDVESSAIPEHDPRFFVNDPDETVFLS